MNPQPTDRMDFADDPYDHRALVERQGAQQMDMDNDCEWYNVPFHRGIITKMYGPSSNQDLIGKVPVNGVLCVSDAADLRGDLSWQGLLY